MLRPDRYTNLALSTLNLSALILETLNSCDSFCTILILETSLTQRLGTDARYNFQNALNFLFLLKAIDYDVKNDVIFLVGDKRHEIDSDL